MWVDLTPCCHAMNDTFRKNLLRQIEKTEKEQGKQSEEGSKAQLIERAGLRKHLPVQRTEHLSDPAHIRWFPCLRYLPAAPCGPATIGCPGPLLFPPHSLILRGLATSLFLLSHQSDCIEENLTLHHPGAPCQTEGSV